MDRDIFETRQESGATRNAPSIHNRLSIAVDVLTAMADDARSLGIHGIADETETMALRLMQFTRDLWRAEGRER